LLEEARSDSTVAEESDQFVDAGGTVPEDRAFRPDIEGLRAVCVVAVVLFHADLFHVRGGYVGVDVFFVISGFVITGTLLRHHDRSGRPRMLDFYARRVVRIVPAATLVVAASIVAERLILGSALTSSAAAGARSATLFFANMRPSIFLAPYWSLGVEEQFYLIYPVIVLLVVVIGRQWSLRAKLGVVLSAIIAVSLAWAVLHPFAAYGSAFGRSWELAVGALLAVMTGYLRKIPRAMAAATTWVGLAALMAIVMTLTFRNDYAGTTDPLAVVAAALIIAGGAAAPVMGAESLLRLAPFKWLGRWSYSLYLWHWPILFIPGLHWGWGIGDWLTRAYLVAFAVAMSAATFFGVENPIRHSIRLNRTALTSIATGAVLIALCLAVISIAS
jgi:peptidoglycan/LPS O-acetylase OafA/YrhL